MFVYRNKKTGSEVMSVTPVTGDNWELVQGEEVQVEEKVEEAPKPEKKPARRKAKK